MQQMKAQIYLSHLCTVMFELINLTVIPLNPISQAVTDLNHLLHPILWDVVVSLLHSCSGQDYHACQSVTQIMEITLLNSFKLVSCPEALQPCLSEAKSRRLRKLPNTPLNLKFYQMFCESTVFLSMLWRKMFVLPRSCLLHEAGVNNTVLYTAAD